MGQILTNERAFLEMIAHSEGTAKEPEPYNVCFGYKHRIFDLRDHPAVTGEWRGEKLSDKHCLGAGLKPGCVSTAAGKYQIIRPTWLSLKKLLNLKDFSPASQDAAALALISQANALTDVHNGDLATAISKCKRIWASLPGAGYSQHENSFKSLVSSFLGAGGTVSEPAKTAGLTENLVTKNA